MIKTLEEILKFAEEYPWNNDLYLEDMNNLSLITRAKVLSEEDSENEKSFKYCLSISSLQDIVNNLKQQTESPNTTQALEALEYYLNNDAFITI